MFVTSNKYSGAVSKIFRDTISVCNKGRTRYIMPPLYTNLHDITDEFASAVCNLPVDYNKDAYRQFLDTWGTVCTFKIQSEHTNY
jgi:intein-encoded DNA endonuclease-like protein